MCLRSISRNFSGFKQAFARVSSLQDIRLYATIYVQFATPQLSVILHDNFVFKLWLKSPHKQPAILLVYLLRFIYSNELIILTSRQHVGEKSHQSKCGKTPLLGLLVYNKNKQPNLLHTNSLGNYVHYIVSLHP